MRPWSSSRVNIDKLSSGIIELTMNEARPEPWSRVLWKTQPFSDNHIPPKLFLVSLQRNPNLEPYSYWRLVHASCAVTQHLSTIYFFLAVFIRLKENQLDPRTLVYISVGCFLAGYFTWNVLDSAEPSSERNANHLKALKSSIMMFLALMSLSPVLRTLSAATSSDSIWALAAILFILNALLANYTASKSGGQIRDRLTSVLSMNAAVSASVVLASRLCTDVAVFALALFSVQAFALFPMLRQRLQTSLVAVWLFLTMFMAASAVYLLASLSQIVMWLGLFTLFFITLIAPIILIWAQRYKNIIRGPWDVAVPKVN